MEERSRNRGAKRAAGEHRGKLAPTTYVFDGSRISRSVGYMRSMHGRALHPTEKPVGILDPLITYACKPGGLIFDPFAGSGSTLDAARCSVARDPIEADERYAELAARRLSQADLFGGAA